MPPETRDPAPETAKSEPAVPTPGDSSATHLHPARPGAPGQQVEEHLPQSQKIEPAGQIAASLAHDLGNLVHVAAGFTGAALETLPPGHGAAADLARVQSALDRAGVLASRLLTLGRPAPARREPIEVNAWAAQLLRLVDGALGWRIQLKFLRGAGVPQVTGDAGLLDQVLLNLCINARAAMPQGGTLTVSTSATADPRAGASGGGAWACVTVADTGQGIAPEVLPRIFEPYFTTKPGGQGTGLGLSTARGIVEQHGGELQVESVPGQGATFRLLLPPAARSVGPAAAGPTAARPAAASPGAIPDLPAPAPGATVLIADDDEAVRALIARVLERRGFRVICASGGEEAVRRSAEAAQPVAMALLDVMMPDLGGLEAARRLRQRDPALPILLCTALPADTVDLTALAGAATEVLSKPYTPAALLRHVFALVGERRAPAAP